MFHGLRIDIYIYIRTHCLQYILYIHDCATVYIYIYIHEDFFHEQKDQFDQFISLNFFESRLMDKTTQKNQVFQTGRVAICENFQGIPAFKIEHS